MPERRGGPGDAGIADENVEFAVALVQRRAESGDAVEITEIEPPAWRISSSSSSSPAWVRATATICAPAFANARAVA